MRTIKEVAGLTGISVRTLQYYDEIGVFKPTKVTDAGYRLYDDASLYVLQQVLFFKELDFPLKDIKRIMEDPGFDKLQAFKEQKALLTAKRDRLDRLLDLLGKLERGEACMGFQAFNLDGYYQIMEQFKNENSEAVIKQWGSLEAFDALLRRMKDHEDTLIESAIRYHGSVEQYVADMKENLSHFSENIEKMERIKQKGYVEKNQELMEKLLQDVSKDAHSQEIQGIIDEMMHLLDDQDRPAMKIGENYWTVLIDGYLHNADIIKAMDGRYGAGASRFIGEALRYYWQGRQPDDVKMH